MKVDVTVFYMVIFQTCHAIVRYIIPITHHCAMMFCLISTDFFNFKRLLCLVPLPLTRRLLQTCSFEPRHLVCLQCFAARQTWDTSSLDCSEFVHFLFYPSRTWHTLQLWKFFVAFSHKNSCERFGDFEGMTSNFHYSPFLITDIVIS